MQQLTNEEKAKVFAMYLGHIAQHIWAGTDTVTNEISGGTIQNISMPTQQYSNYQILLTPLSAITDEHAIELYKLNALYPKSVTDNEMAIESAKEWISMEIFPISWLGYQYLISKGYNVPQWFGVGHWANGKTAIELDIAIDKTKISA